MLKMQKGKDGKKEKNTKNQTMQKNSKKKDLIQQFLEPLVPIGLKSHK